MGYCSIPRNFEGYLAYGGVQVVRQPKHLAGERHVGDRGRRTSLGRERRESPFAGGPGGECGPLGVGVLDEMVERNRAGTRCRSDRSSLTRRGDKLGRVILKTKLHNIQDKPRYGKPLSVLFVHVYNPRAMRAVCAGCAGARCRERRASQTTTARSDTSSETRRAKYHPHGETRSKKTTAARSSSAASHRTSVSSRSRKVAPSSLLCATCSDARPTGPLPQDRRPSQRGLSHLQPPGALKGHGRRLVPAFGRRGRRPRQVRRQVHRRT